MTLLGEMQITNGKISLKDHSHLCYVPQGKYSMELIIFLNFFLRTMDIFGNDSRKYPLWSRI